MQITRFWRKVSPGLALASMFPCRKFAKVPECPTVAATLQKHASPWLRPRDQAGGGLLQPAHCSCAAAHPNRASVSFWAKNQRFWPRPGRPQKVPFLAIFGHFPKAIPFGKMPKMAKNSTFSFTVLAIFGHFSGFCQKTPIFGHFWPFLAIFWPFLAIFCHFFAIFWPFLAILGHFWCTARAAVAG